MSREGAWRAAVLAAGPRSALSHTSAAAHLGIRPTSAAAVHVTVENRARSRPGIRVHRSSLPPKEVTIRDGIPTTTPTRTLLDIASVMTDGDLLRALRQAGHLRLFDRAAIDAVIARAPRPGRGRLAAAMRAMTVTGSEPRATHATAEAFEADRARDARLLAAGYRVVRFTYRQVTSEPEAVARTIRSLLAVPGIAT